jgi:hypothetical protein
MHDDAPGDKNSVVLRINRIAKQVMKTEWVGQMDIDRPLAAQLDLTAGDEFHWSSSACQVVSDAILKRLTKCEASRAS